MPVHLIGRNDRAGTNFPDFVTDDWIEIDEDDIILPDYHSHSFMARSILSEMIRLSSLSFFICLKSASQILARLLLGRLYDDRAFFDLHDRFFLNMALFKHRLGEF